MKPESAGPRWETYEAKAHLSEVHAIIRRGFSRGTIRVVSAAGGGIRIVPTSNDRPLRAPQRFPTACPDSIGPIMHVWSGERRAR
jgi:hypothetical protein